MGVQTHRIAGQAWRAKDTGREQERRRRPGALAHFVQGVITAAAAGATSAAAAAAAPACVGSTRPSPLVQPGASASACWCGCTSRVRFSPPYAASTTSAPVPAFNLAAAAAASLLLALRNNAPSLAGSCSNNIATSLLAATSAPATRGARVHSSFTALTIVALLLLVVSLRHVTGEGQGLATASTATATAAASTAAAIAVTAAARRKAVVGDRGELRTGKEVERT